MKRRIFLRCFGVAAAAVMVCCVLSGFIISLVEEKSLADSLLQMETVLLGQYDLEQESEETAQYISQLTGGNRVTIIDAQGTVLIDTGAKADEMENHAQRPEMILARQGERAVEKRYSATLGRNMLYVAKMDNNGTILRIAVPLETLRTNLMQTLPAFVIGILAALICSQLLSRRMADDVLTPLVFAQHSMEQLSEEQNPAGQIAYTGYEEIDGIVKSMNLMAQNISHNIAALAYERDKAEMILNNLDEALILVDAKNELLHINRSAVKFFHCGSQQELIRQPFYRITREPAITTAMERAIQEGVSSFFDFEITAPDYMILGIRISPVLLSRKNDPQRTGGAMLVASDVTQLRRTEQIRSEFIANAAHELKSPITSIKGFAELLSSGIVEDESKKRDYLARISQESERMMRLTEDILQLSMLESELKAENTTQIELAGAVKDILRELEPQAQLNQVSLRMSGERCFVQMSREDLSHIVRNLCDNAIKYNKPGGSVTVQVRNLGDKAELVVSDTGIGIPAQYHSRIFERFFRVDKSRSRKMGSTGLGLAIVKHTLALYGGGVTLESKEGVGTTISVTLPKLSASMAC